MPYPAARLLARAALVGALCAVTVTPAATASAAPTPTPPGSARPNGLAATPSPALSATSRADLARQLDQASQELEVVIEQFNGLQAKLGSTQAQSAQAAAAAVPLRLATEAMRARLGTVAAGLYRQLGVQAATLLSADSMGTLVEQLTTYEHLAFQWRAQLAELTGAQARYEAQQRSLDTLATTQRAEQAALAAKKATIEAKLTGLKQLRQQFYGTSAVRGPAADTFVPPPQPGAAGAAVHFAYAQIGRWYQWGAAGPTTYDCSGLVMASWRAGGVSLPHNAAMMWRSVHHLNKDQLQPGDLVFYYRDIHHVGIYIGGGRIIHAPTYGQSVTIAPVTEAPVYGYGRP